MRNFKLFAFAAIMTVSQVHTVDIPKLWKSGTEYSGKQLARYGNNLLHDDLTQGVTLTSVVGSVAAYQYYYYQAALVCLDGHINSKIMHKSDLLYMTYSNFLNKLAAIHSYAETVEFMNQYCTTCYALSDSKINRLIALVGDLQMNNINQMSNNADQENMILENFKNQLILAQENIKQELINNAINANKNANNAITVRLVIDIISALFGNSK